MDGQHYNSKHGRVEPFMFPIDRHITMVPSSILTMFLSFWLTASPISGATIMRSAGVLLFSIYGLEAIHWNYDCFMMSEQWVENFRRWFMFASKLDWG
jgi:hypothetical protein